MQLEKHSAKIGARLFRWRSYLPLFFILVMIPSFLEFRYPYDLHAYDLIWEMFCLVISLCGLVFRCYTVGYVPKGTSGRNTKRQIADTLNTTGIYSVTRNPLYLGNYFMMLGVIMFVRVWWVSSIYTLAFWIYYARIISAEAAFLKDKFGKEYVDYVKRTPGFAPNFKLWKSPALSFSLRNVLKREYSGFFGAIAAFTVFEFVGDYSLEKSIVYDPIWVSLFTFALLTYIVLMALKKKTRLLHVEGR